MRIRLKCMNTVVRPTLGCGDQPHSEVLLPKGALCRAQEEIYESNEVKQEIKNSTGGTSPLHLESDPVPKKQRIDTQDKNGRERQRIDP